MPEPIYLDHQASTPISPAVQEAMAPWLSGRAGNPHSASHMHGVQAAYALKAAKGKIADWCDCDEDDIILTSGATESCNLALRSLVQDEQEEWCIITAKTEHDAVRKTVEDLEDRGVATYFVQPEPCGTIAPTALEATLRRVDNGGSNRVVSIMAANNETGAVNDIELLAALAKEYGAHFHCDATQAASRMNVDAIVNHADLATFSSHKMYGPPGVGVLIAKREIRQRMRECVTGGQQQVVRSGTVPTMLAVGLGQAAVDCANSGAKSATSMEKCIAALQSGLSRNDVPWHGTNPATRLPGTICLRIEGITGRWLCEQVAGHISIARGSACHADSGEDSETLAACGYAEHELREFVRISFGWRNTETDATTAVEAITNAWKESNHEES